MGRALIFVLALLLAGCSRNQSLIGPDALVFVPGVAGDGPWYDGIRQGLSGPVQSFKWGAPPPMTVMNFQDRGIHERAEKELAARITEFASKYPGGRLVLVGHSAGCGVILGALRRLPEEAGATTVVLLAPSVSPDFDLTATMPRVHDQTHVFHSTRDDFFLDWRTSTFGTYDNVKSPAAGNVGFHSVGALPPDLRQRVVQHPYQEAWNALGNDGSHFGPVARRFVAEIVAPLLSVPATRSTVETHP
jgi:pimeloyl-ACP methyl ester carboxylesterase